MVTNKRKREKILEAIERIKKEYQPEKIILFGSYAYGHPTEDSDVDLFIIKDTNKRRIERFCEVSRIIREIKGIPFQPVVFTNKEVQERMDIEDDFINQILTKGEILYERQS